VKSTGIGQSGEWKGADKALHRAKKETKGFLFTASEEWGEGKDGVVRRGSFSWGRVTDKKLDDKGKIGPGDDGFPWGEGGYD